jgi:hypothetical protein
VLPAGRTSQKKSRLKGGCSQDWLPHDYSRLSHQEIVAYNADLAANSDLGKITCPT